MTLETFFEKFDLFADAPNAVVKMRQLILQLAVEGRLVERSSGWERRLLKSLATKIGSGATPNGGRESYFSTGIPLIRSMNVHFKGFDKTGLVFLSDAQADQLSGVTVQTNDVLLNITGASIGRVTTAPNDMSGARVNQHVTIIRPTSELLPRFLSIFLASPAVQAMIDDVQVGATRQALTKGMIEQFEIPLPPLAEQNRIVEKVDELTALCDQLEAQQQARSQKHADLARASLARFTESPTPANLEFIFHKSYNIPPAELRKTILSLAIRGKLVPQDSDDEPAIESLVEIDTEKGVLIEARKLRPNRVTEIPNTKELQYDVPDNWRWFRLGDVAFFQEGPGIRNWQFRSEGIKLLNVQNIVNGKLVLENTDRHISVEEFESTYQHFAVEAGDILFASSGASWGKTAWFVDPGYTVMLNTSMVRLKFYSKRCDDAYLINFLRTEFFKNQMDIQLVGIQPNFGSTHLGRVYIPLPPVAEQRRIVAKVELLMSMVETLEKRLAASNATSGSLLTAVLSELAEHWASTFLAQKPLDRQ